MYDMVVIQTKDCAGDIVVRPINLVNGAIQKTIKSPITSLVIATKTANVHMHNVGVHVA